MTLIQNTESPLQPNLPSTVYIASDHTGFRLKQALFEYLQEFSSEVHDLGVDSEEKSDYPLVAQQTVPYIQENKSWGIIICGSGIGMSMAVNRFSHIRGALCTSPLMAELARSHNNANLLILGARLTPLFVAKEIISRFKEINWEGNRHLNRVNQLSQLPNAQQKLFL